MHDSLGRGLLTPEYPVTRAYALIAIAIGSISCSSSEVVLEGRTPERVLLYAARTVTPSPSGSGPWTRTDSIWLYNAKLTKLRTGYRVWIEQEWFVDPPIAQPDLLRERTLIEMDCTRGAFREGASSGEIPQINTPWKVPRPRTVQSAYLDSLCAFLRSPR